MPEMPAPTIRTSKCSDDVEAEMERAVSTFIVDSVPWAWPLVGPVSSAWSAAEHALTNDIDQTLKESQRKTPLPHCLHNPVSIEGERRDAGQTTAAGATVRPGRPADNPDNCRAALLILEHRPAGIPGAGP